MHIIVVFGLLLIRFSIFMLLFFALLINTVQKLLCSKKFLWIIWMRNNLDFLLILKVRLIWNNIIYLKIVFILIKIYLICTIRLTTTTLIIFKTLNLWIMGTHLIYGVAKIIETCSSWRETWILILNIASTRIIRLIGK